MDDIQQPARTCHRCMAPLISIDGNCGNCQVQHSIIDNDLAFSFPMRAIRQVFEINPDFKDCCIRRIMNCLFRNLATTVHVNHQIAKEIIDKISGVPNFSERVE